MLLVAAEKLGPCPVDLMSHTHIHTVNNICTTQYTYNTCSDYDIHMSNNTGCHKKVPNIFTKYCCNTFKVW